MFPENVKDINGTLHFTNVTTGDKGQYICVATNSQGIINATIDIDVIGMYVGVLALHMCGYKFTGNYKCHH